MSTDAAVTDVAGIVIPFLRPDEFFVVKPTDGKQWLHNTPLPGRYTAFGQCECGARCFCYVVYADAESGMPAHTVIRCAGDYGCKARAVIPKICHNYGDILLATPNFQDKQTSLKLDILANSIS